MLHVHLHRLQMQKHVMVFTKLLVRTSGWLLGATVLHLRGDLPTLPLDQSVILCSKIVCNADLCFFQEAAWRDKDHFSQNVKFDSPFTARLSFLASPTPFYCLSSLYSILLLPLVCALTLLLSYSYRGESGYDFAIRTPCTPSRWDAFDAEMTMAWEVSPPEP